MMKRLLITGAAGGLGRLARSRLGHVAQILRLSDIVDPGAAGDGEEVVVCDLGDAQAVDQLVAGCDAILHLGGISVEDKFSAILNANITGVHNLYEATRRHGHPRIFLASSNHVIGFYKNDDMLDAAACHRPDSYYGVSKSFAEAMALMYFHKYGQETAMVRIGSCFPEPVDHRMLATWLSPDDFIALVECVFKAPKLGCPVIYGASANDGAWWDNSACAYLGWRPKDNSAMFRDKIEASVVRPSADDPAAMYQGGKFAANPIIEE